MTDDENWLESFVTGVLDDSPTFSEEMIEKVRNELLKAENDAKDYYAKMAGN
jgi:hypothetical protein